MANPNLRQASAESPVTPAIVESGEGYEALLALAMFTGDEAEESYEVGRDWFIEARRRASPRLKAALTRLLGKAGGKWFLLLGMVHETGGRRDLPALIDRLRSLPPMDTLLALLGGHLPRLRLEKGRRLVELALAGDRAAAGAVAALTHPGDGLAIRRLAGLGPDTVRALTVEILERWQEEVFAADRDLWLRAIEMDATAKAQLAEQVTAEHLIDRVTGGISYRGEAGIDQVLLVPTVASRPWVVICEWDSTKLFCYPAATAVPGQKEGELAVVYRALGDETRLRILHELAAGDRRIADLALSLGLAKSTIHSHLTILRRSGLVGLTIGAEKLYGIRPSRPDLNDLLDRYLHH